MAVINHVTGKQAICVESDDISDATLIDNGCGPKVEGEKKPYRERPNQLVRH
jgi:hypothetical protein